MLTPRARPHCMQLARALNNFENHRTVQTHENRLIAKIFVFFFIDSYMWFYLLAFFHIPFGRQIDAFVRDALGMHFDKPFEKRVWMGRLGQTIGAVMSITQWFLVFFVDAYFPYLLKMRLKARARWPPSHLTPSPPLPTPPPPPRLPYFAPRSGPAQPFPTPLVPTSAGTRERALAESVPAGRPIALIHCCRVRHRAPRRRGQAPISWRTNARAVEAKRRRRQRARRRQWRSGGSVGRDGGTRLRPCGRL